MIKRIIKILLLIFIVSLLPVFIYKWINPPFTFIQQSQSELRGVKGEWLSYEEIPRDFIISIIASEDQKFFEHSGFDLEAIESALEYNKSHKSKRGASTISQQTAKNTFCWGSRSWLRKAIESYYTILIEWVWGKKRIIEVYVNIIEMGRGTFGIDEAAKYYFKIKGHKLNHSQCVSIVSMLPCPRTCGMNHPLARARQRLIERAFQGKWVELPGDF